MGHFGRVLGIQEDTFGVDHIETADTNAQIGFCCAKGGDEEIQMVGLYYFERSWRIREDKLGQDHEETVQAKRLFESYLQILRQFKIGDRIQW